MLCNNLLRGQKYPENFKGGKFDVYFLSTGWEESAGARATSDGGWLLSYLPA
jgi:hypothetical protein